MVPTPGCSLAGLFLLVFYEQTGYYNDHIVHGAHSSVVERRFVVPKVEGSIPSGHPIMQKLRKEFFVWRKSFSRTIKYCILICNMTKHSNEHLLDFPEVRQGTDYTCGDSAMQAVLYYYGIEFREDQLIKRLHTTHDGTDPEAIEDFAKAEGFSVDMRAMNIADIKEYIDKSVPVIVDIQAWSGHRHQNYKGDYDDGHYVVVIGYDDERFIFEDPSLMNRGYLTFAEFLERWHDVGNGPKGPHITHRGIAIYGKPPRFRSSTIKHIR